MTKKIFTLTCLLFLTSCADSMGSLRRDLNASEKAINDIRSFQAEQATEISSIRSEMRNLTGRMDDLEHSQSTKLGSDIGSLKSDLTELKRRVPPPAVVPVAALEADEVLAGTLSEEINRLFTDSLLRIREGNFANAVPLLQSALDLSSGRDWSANIIFWLGVSYEGLGDNKRALGAYNEVASRFSKHERAPLALYRQSGILNKFGDTQTAKLTLKKLITDYPKSPLAAEAKQKLK